MKNRLRKSGFPWHRPHRAVHVTKSDSKKRSKDYKGFRRPRNEPFYQGPVNFKATCGLAAERMIIVNTIHCGNYQTGIDTFWQMGATIGKGSYFAIDSDKVTEGTPSPFDDDLIKLNSEMNKTYIPYGSYGKQNLKRQSAQDSNAAEISKSAYAGRAASKGSKLYKSSSWDLVDAIEENKITVDKVNREHLPKNLQNKTDEELKVYVQKKKERTRRCEKTNCRY